MLSANETSKPGTQSEREEDTQTRIPGTNGTGRTLGRLGRAPSTLLPQRQDGRPPFALESMLRIHFLQQWFSLSDPAMEEAFFETPLYREFAQLQEFERLPDESTILRFRHRLEKYKLAEHILETVNELLSAQGFMDLPGSS